MIKKFVVSSLLVGLAFGLVVTVVFGVCYKSYDTYSMVWASTNPPSTWFIKVGSVYGFPLAWNTVGLYKTVIFCFGEPNIAYFLLDTILWGAIGGVPLAFWVVRREDMKWKLKTAKFVFLAVSIPLLVFSPLFIFHTEFEEPSIFPPVDYSYAVQQMWMRTYYMIFGLFLFIVGLVLIVASYYRHGETNLPMKI